MSRHIYSEAEAEFMNDFAWGHSYKEITAAVNGKFNLSLRENQVKAYMKNHGMKTGRDGRFEKGHVPANKGKHTQTKGHMAETQFKKGQTPKNHLPVGSVRIRCSRKGRKPYVWEKVAEPNVWRMKHVLEWEKHNGPVPEGKIVIFADGDTLNTDISNLLLVSRAQHAVMNRWNLKGESKELSEAAANIANLKIQISKAKKLKKKKKER